MNDINKLLSGDTQFVKNLIKDVFPVVKSFVLRNSGSIEDAKDLIQDTLYIVIDKLRKGLYQADTNLSGFCVSVAKNEWMNQIRKENTRKKYKDFIAIEMDQLAKRGNPEEVFNDRSKEIDQHINQLSEPCKNLIKMHYFMKVTLVDIAPLLGYTQNFVKIKHKRCLEQFRTTITKMSKTI